MEFWVLHRPELEVLPAAQHLGIGVIAYSPLGGGMLSGHVFQHQQGSRTGQQREKVEKHRAQLENYLHLCSQLDLDPAHVALAWVLQNPAITAPVIGPRTIDQFQHSLHCLSVRLENSNRREGKK